MQQSKHNSKQETQEVMLSINGLHPKQVEIFNSNKRFKVIAAGRRWGKSRLGQALAFDAAWRGGKVWWVAPTYPIASISWRDMKNRALKIGAKSNEVEKMITMPTGGFIQVKSADNAKGLRGEGLDRVIVDEAAFLSESAWTEALRPTLSDREGDAYLGSTPNGRNWFYRMFQDPGFEGQSWQIPTADNPTIKEDEINAAREMLSIRVFEQEYEAKFLDLSGAVFRNVRSQAIAAEHMEAWPGHQYCMGVDWARSGDFTAVVVVDIAAQSIIHAEKWTGVEYSLQLNRIRAIMERYKPEAIISEVNNMGGPLYEQLRDEDWPILPFTTTNASKLQLVDTFSLLLERQILTLYKHQGLIDELESYQSTKLASGLLRYSAPSGVHDDLAVAAMLAVWGSARCADDYAAKLM